MRNSAQFWRCHRRTINGSRVFKKAGLKGDLMKRQGLFIAALFLSAALVAPLASKVSAAPQLVSVRVYDRDHKDYHNWDDNEARHYESYRHEHHEYNVEFKRTSREQQRAYWRWRHEHPE
jgi:hypothetical protein